MGSTKKLFTDMREVEDYPPFDHEKNFCRKVKENWLTTERLTELTCSTDIYELTNALIDYKMQPEDATIIMAHLDLYEPNYINEKTKNRESKYIVKVIASTLENMKRVYKKYTQDDSHNMRSDYKAILLIKILEKERRQKDQYEKNQG